MASNITPAVQREGQRKETPGKSSRYVQASAEE